MGTKLGEIGDGARNSINGEGERLRVRLLLCPSWRNLLTSLGVIGLRTTTSSSCSSSAANQGRENRLEPKSKKLVGDRGETWHQLTVVLAGVRVYFGRWWHQHWGEAAVTEELIGVVCGSKGGGVENRVRAQVQKVSK